MSTDSLERLMVIMPPPEQPVDRPTTEDWARTERWLGVGLPADYKAIVERYGSGSIGEFLWILNPAAAQPWLRFEDNGQEMLDIIREIRSFEEIPFPIHPEVDGLIPWGRTDNGDAGYWVASLPEHPEQWTIVMNPVRSPNWVTFEGPFAEFLESVLMGSPPVQSFFDLIRRTRGKRLARYSLCRPRQVDDGRFRRFNWVSPRSGRAR